MTITDDEETGKKLTTMEVSPPEETDGVMTDVVLADATPATTTTEPCRSNCRSGSVGLCGTPVYKAFRSAYAVFSVHGIFAFAVANGVLSILAVNGICSVCSINSVLSVGSVNSVLSIGCVNSFMKNCLN